MSIGKNNLNAIFELMDGNTKEAGKSFGKSIKQFSDSFGIYAGPSDANSIMKIGQGLAPPELPPEVQAQNARMAMPQFDPVNAAAVAANDPFAATNAEALQTISRNTRGQR